jgi:hypothetical protein
VDLLARKRLQLNKKYEGSLFGREKALGAGWLEAVHDGEGERDGEEDNSGGDGGPAWGAEYPASFSVLNWKAKREDMLRGARGTRG